MKTCKSVSTGVIYELVAPNNKEYIGQTINWKRRKGSHRTSANNPKYEKSPKLYNSVRKYGWENFQKNVIYQNVPEEFIDIMEIITIELRDTYHNGLNGCPGGNCTRGRICKLETRAKIAKKATGRKKSTDTIALLKTIMSQRSTSKYAKRTGSVVQYTTNSGPRWLARIMFDGKRHNKTFKTHNDAMEWIKHFKEDRGV